MAMEERVVEVGMVGFEVVDLFALEGSVVLGLG